MMIYQLHSSQHSLLGDLFPAPPANEPMLRAFLEGGVPGHALVDAVPRPAAIAVAVNYRFVFFGGRPNRAFQESALRQLRFDQPLDVVWPAGRIALPTGAKPTQIVPRLEFHSRRNRSEGHLDKLAASAPNAEVRRIDSSLIRRCLWRDDVLRATGSTSEFLGHGLGFCLMLDEEIVAEAYAVIWSGERAEIATVTHPDHRGRGYATVLCASLIKACEAVDLKTYWNCDASNETSTRLATRLGYTDAREYRLLRYTQQGPVARRSTKRRASFGEFARGWIWRVARRR